MQNISNRDIDRFIEGLVDIAETDTIKLKPEQKYSIGMDIKQNLFEINTTLTAFVSKSVLSVITNADQNTKWSAVDILHLQNEIKEYTRLYPYFDNEGMRISGSPFLSEYDVFISSSFIRDAQILYADHQTEESEDDPWETGDVCDFSEDVYIGSVIAKETSEACKLASEKHGYPECILFAVPHT